MGGAHCRHLCQRAGFYRDSGDLDQAFADYEKSYASYPTSLVAEQLGDAALKKGDSGRAVDYYLAAFVFPDKNPDLAAARRFAASSAVCIGSSTIPSKVWETSRCRATTPLCHCSPNAFPAPSLRTPAATIPSSSSWSGWMAPNYPWRVPRQGRGDGFLGDLVRPLPLGKANLWNRWPKVFARIRAPLSCR